MQPVYEISKVNIRGLKYIMRFPRKAGLHVFTDCDNFHYDSSNRVYYTSNFKRGMLDFKFLLHVIGVLRAELKLFEWSVHCHAEGRKHWITTRIRANAKCRVYESIRCTI